MRGLGFICNTPSAPIASSVLHPPIESATDSGRSALPAASLRIAEAGVPTLTSSIERKMQPAPHSTITCAPTWGKVRPTVRTLTVCAPSQQRRLHRRRNAIDAGKARSSTPGRGAVIRIRVGHRRVHVVPVVNASGASVAGLAIVTQHGRPLQMSRRTLRQASK
jgi:hypothetical protein